MIEIKKAEKKYIIISIALLIICIAVFIWLLIIILKDVNTVLKPVEGKIEKMPQFNIEQLENLKKSL